MYFIINKLLITKKAQKVYIKIWFLILYIYPQNADFIEVDDWVKGAQINLVNMHS